jgi:TadE-like protein
MTEFALVSLLFLVLVFGVIDFGVGIAGANGLANASRVGARYAAVHPKAWSSAANPPANTIQGEIQLVEGLAMVPNDDAHICISYWVPSLTSSGAVAAPGGDKCHHSSSGCTTANGCCGYYQEAGPEGFEATGIVVGGTTYTEDLCVAKGNLIQVNLVYTYKWLTPFPGLSHIGSAAGLNLAALSWMLEEQ